MMADSRPFLLGLVVACQLLMQAIASTGDPYIDEINPRSGSVAGNTELYAFGGNLQWNNKEETPNLAFFVNTMTGEINRARVEIKQCKDNVLTIITPPLDAGNYHVKVFINGKMIPNEKMCKSDKRKCIFQASDYRTPIVSSVKPKYSKPGDVVEICGKLITDRVDSTKTKGSNGRTEQLQRINVCSRECTIVEDPSAKPFYGETGCIKCRLPSVVGSCSVEVVIGGQYGSSKPSPSCLYVRKDRLYTLELSHEISSVKPSLGSTAGGTKLTIEGQNFLEGVKKVTIGGQVCEVKKVTTTSIECITPEEPKKKSTVGNRGAILETWADSSCSFEALQKDTPTLRNYERKELDETHIPSTIAGTCSRITGYFIPDKNDLYKFGVKGNTCSKVYFNPHGESKDQLELVATNCDSATSTYFESNKQWSTKEFNLTAEKAYRLRVDHVHEKGAGGVSVSAMRPSTTVPSVWSSEIRAQTYIIEVTSEINDETQIIKFKNWPNRQSGSGKTYVVTASGTGTYFLKIGDKKIGPLSPKIPLNQRDLENEIGTGKVEIKGSTHGRYVIIFKDDVTLEIVKAAGSETSLETMIATPTKKTVNVNLVGVTSDIPFSPDMDKKIIEKAILDAFSTKCSYLDKSVAFSDDFEHLSDNHCHFAHCGLKSLKNPTEIKLYRIPAGKPSTTTKDDYLSSFSTYKYLCFAQRGDIGKELTITHTLTAVSPSSFVSTTVDIEDDFPKTTAEWKFRCSNILDKVISKRPSLSTVSIKIEKVKFKTQGDAYIDSLMLAGEDLTPFVGNKGNLQTSAVPDDKRIKEVIVDKIDNSTLKITLKSCDCSHEFGLFKIGNLGNAQVEVTCERKASPPVSGRFKMAFDGKDMPDFIAVDATAEEFRRYTQGTMGKLAVTLQKNCHGNKWKTVLQQRTGRQPELSISSSSLFGDKPSVKVNQRQMSNNQKTNGGVLPQALAGHMLATDHTQPQVGVIINDVAARCSGQICDFQWSSASTPTVTGVVADNNGKLTITGRLFGTELNGFQVYIGGTPCAVETVTDTEVTCTPQTLPGGKHAVVVNVPGKGKSPVDESVSYQVPTTVTSVLPKGSAVLKACSKGGTILEIKGQGLSAQHKVVINGKQCPVKHAEYTVLTCTIPSGEDGTYSMKIFDNGGKEVHQAQFEYGACAVEVASISPKSICEQGSTLTITGTGFQQNMHLKVGKTEVTISESTSTTLKAQLPPLSIGKHLVQLSLNNGENAKFSIPDADRTLSYDVEVFGVSSPQGRVSVKDGTICFLRGRCFPQDLKDTATITIGNLPCKIKEVEDSKTIRCSVESGNKNELVQVQPGMPKIASIEVKEGYSITWTCDYPAVVNGHNILSIHICKTDGPMSISCGQTLGEIKQCPGSAVSTLPLGIHYVLISANAEGSNQMLYFETISVVGKEVATLTEATLKVGGREKRIVLSSVSSEYTMQPQIVNGGVSPLTGSTMGGTTVTIVFNKNIDGTTLLVCLDLDEKKCQAGTLSVCPNGRNVKINSKSLKTLTIRTPAHTSATVSIGICSNGLVAKFNFQYDASSTPDCYQATKAGNTVTLAGMGFDPVCTKNKIWFCTTQGKCVYEADATAPCSSSVLTYQASDKVPAGRYQVKVEVKGKGLSTVCTGTVEIPMSVTLTNKCPAGTDATAGAKMCVSGNMDMASTILVGGTAAVAVTKAGAKTLCFQAPKSVTGTVDVTVVSNGVTKVAGTFTYTAAVQKPKVNNINPATGDVKKEITIEILGQNFGTVDIYTVRLGTSSECTVQTVTDTKLTVKCKRKTATPTKEKVEVISHCSGLSEGDVDFTWFIRWSDAFNCSAGIVKMYVIQPKLYVLYDDVNCKAKCFDMLVIRGTLAFSDDMDLMIRAKRIFIDGGRLEVGTENKPHTKKAIIELCGHVKDKPLPIYGTKVLAVRNGNLDLHGLPVKHTWTRLAQPASKGDDYIIVQDDPTDWNVGSEIVIATTGARLSQNETEKVKITAIENNTGGGYKIKLDRQLKFDHMAKDVTCGRKTVRMRAEVGLLSRRVIVRGTRDDTWKEVVPACTKGFDPGEFKRQTCFRGRFGQETNYDDFGVHLIFHCEKLCLVRISNIEITHAGQAFNLGRYPLHFHLSKDNMAGSYVKKNSIHNTFNRAINIHATNNILVEENVVYDVMGGAIFLEDGIETNNTFKYNLVVFVKPSTSLLNDDITPAGFWATHPNNNYIGNAAVGGTHFGFWYRLHTHPDGPSFTRSVSPLTAPLGTFTGNTAHSFGWFGLWVFPHYFPPTQAVFGEFDSWNNEKGAEAVDVGAIKFLKFTTIDNEKAGIEFKRVIPDRSLPFCKDKGTVVERSNFCGKSATSTHCTNRGLIHPFSSGLLVYDCEFINFTDDNCAALGKTRIDGTCTVDCGSFSDMHEDTNVTNSPHVVFAAWKDEFVYIDKDGSLTGTLGARLIPTNSALPPQCSNYTKIAPKSIPVSKCDANMKQLVRCAFNAALPTSLQGKSLVLTTSFGKHNVPFKHKGVTHKDGWTVALICNQTYKVEFTGVGIIGIAYNGKCYNLNADQTPCCLIIQHEFEAAPDRFRIFGTNWQSKTKQTQMVTCASNVHGDYYFDAKTKTLSYIVSAKQENNLNPATGPCVKSVDSEIRFKSMKCVYPNCIHPKLQPSTVDCSTAVNENWEDFIKTQDLNHVVIPKDKCVYVTKSICGTSTPVNQLVKLLTVKGYLGFKPPTDKSECIFCATLIIIDGGKMVAGTKANPYDGKLTILLKGNRGTQLKSSIGPIYAKGIYLLHGELSLYGRPLTKTWYKLKTEAKAGSQTLTIVGGDGRILADDKLIVTTTSFNVKETEEVTVARVDKIKSNGKVTHAVITIKERLKYNHKAGDVNACDGTTLKRLAAEVAVLSRCINIRGDIEAARKAEKFGASVFVLGRWLVTAIFSYVRFDQCGQYGYVGETQPHYCLAMRELNKGDTVSVEGSSFTTSYTPALGIFDSHVSLDVSGNVLYNTLGSAMQFSGTKFNIRDNLAARSIWDEKSGERTSFWFGSFEYQKAKEIVVVGNCAAGSERAAYRVAGDDQFSSSSPTNPWNEAHGTLIGLLLYKHEEVHKPNECTKLSGCLVWRSLYAGIYTQTQSCMEISGVALLDNIVGAYSTVYAPKALEHGCVKKHVTVKDSLVVGTSGVTDCTDEAKVDRSSANFKNSIIASPGSMRAGIGVSSYLSSYNKAPIKPFFGSMSYPGIEAKMTISGVRFMKFKKHSSCQQKKIFALAVNPSVEDHTIPVDLRNIQKCQVDDDSIIHIPRPGKRWINPSDCVDMPCDGKKKCVIMDIDGSFMGSGSESFIISDSAYEWNGDRAFGTSDARIPKPALANANGNKQDPSKLYPRKGIPHAGCTWQGTWQAFSCPKQQSKKKFGQLLIDSLDSDTETRRLSPIAVVIEDTDSTQCIDLINGPQDHGWCHGYTCQKRISTFWAVVVLGTNKEAKVYMTSNVPAELRLKLLNAASTDYVVVSIYYNDAHPVVVHRGCKKGANNTVAGSKSANDLFKVGAVAGTNHQNMNSGFTSVRLQGDTPVILSLDTDSVVIHFKNCTVGAVSLDEFFGKDFVKYVALYFGIDKKDIKVLAIDNGKGNRRRRSTSGVDVVIQILLTGSNPSSQSTAIQEKITKGIQSGEFQTVVKMPGITIKVYRERPKIGTPAYKAAMTNTGSHVLVEYVSNMYLLRVPVIAAEGERFTGLVIIFGSPGGSQVKSVGTDAEKWTVTVSIVGGNARLVGVTSVTVKDGKADFTSLSIHGSGKIVLNFKSSKNNLSFNVTVKVAKRSFRPRCSASVVSTDKGKEVTLVASIENGNDKRKKANLKWKNGTTWSAALIVNSKARNRGTVKGKQTGVIDYANNTITFSGLTAEKAGTYPVTIRLRSSEGDTFRKVCTFEIRRTLGKNPKKKNLRIRFNNGDIKMLQENEGDVLVFHAMFRNIILEIYPRIDVASVSTSPGSIVVNFQAQGEENDLNAFLSEFHASLNQFNISFNGYVMNADGSLQVDGEEYGDGLSVGEKAIIGVIVSLVIGAIIIGVAVYCAKKKKKNKLDVKRRTSLATQFGLKRTPVTSLTDDDISLYWQGQTPRYPTTEPPPYSSRAPSRIDTPIHTSHMPPTRATIHRFSVSKLPEELRKSENFTDVE